MTDNSALLAFAKELAHDAGEIMLKYFYADDKGVETKQDGSSVTIADKEINQLVIDRVAEHFPEHGVLAEEGSSHENRRELWVCDPIDGTKDFARGVSTALFSLAYVVDGEPQVAVVLNPFRNKLYSAIKGEGAFVNDQPLQVSGTASFKDANIAFSANYKELKIRRTFFDRVLDDGAKITLVGGSFFRAMLVASGSADATVFPGLSAHDVASSKLIIEEAGGRVTDLAGKDQRYDGPTLGAIISNGLLHDELVARVADFGAENFKGH